LVSTKTGTVVQFPAGGTAPGVLDHDGGSGQVAPHGVLVGGLGAQVLVQQPLMSRETAHVAVCRPDPGSAGGLLVETDGDIPHGTILVST
jgi:hypothetical protein